MTDREQSNNLRRYHDEQLSGEELWNRIWENEEEELQEDFNGAVEPLMLLFEEYFFKRKVFNQAMTIKDFRKKILEMVEEVLWET